LSFSPDRATFGNIFSSQVVELKKVALERIIRFLQKFFWSLEYHELHFFNFDPDFSNYRKSSGKKSKNFLGQFSKGFRMHRKVS